MKAIFIILALVGCRTTPKADICTQVTALECCTQESKLSGYGYCQCQHLNYCYGKGYIGKAR